MSGKLTFEVLILFAVLITIAGASSLIASSVWTVNPEFSPLAWAITMLVLSTSAAVIVSRKKAKRQFERPVATLQHPKKRSSLTVERKHQTDNYGCVNETTAVKKAGR